MQPVLIVGGGLTGLVVGLGELDDLDRLALRTAAGEAGAAVDVREAVEAAGAAALVAGREVARRALGDVEAGEATVGKGLSEDQ